MALFEDEDFEDSEEITEITNEYLQNEEKGMELVKSLLCNNYNKNDNNSEEFEKILENELMPLLARIEFKDELEIYYELKHVTERIKEQKKINMLKSKAVLGVGGKFSAGKSCFINSITNAELPEDQKPTTSIATYIIKSEVKNNIAFTYNNQIIELNDEAISALTHDFYKKYNIGFSRIIQNLVVQSPEFIYPNIAVLDTPGYSKSDINKNESASDAEIAREQLKSVDFLIWLVDSENGIIQENDLNFIDSLNITNPILVVFNKAGLKTKEEIEKIVEQSKELLSQTSKNIYDVIAYDSIEKKTIIGEGILEKYLEEVNLDSSKMKSLSEQIKDISQNLLSQLDDQIKQCTSKINSISDLIIKDNDIKRMKSLLNDYSFNFNYRLSINVRKYTIEHIIDKLSNLLIKIDKENSHGR